MTSWIWEVYKKTSDFFIKNIIDTGKIIYEKQTTRLIPRVD
jgi:hypothetical protein